MAENTSKPLVILFVSLHTFVWIASTLIILTVVFSHKVQRQSTWLNLNLSWIFACFSFALLLTAGQLFKPEPSTPICLAQAAASTSVPSLTSGTTLAFALHLWFNMRSSLHLDRLELRRATFRNIALIVVPYVVPLVMFVAAFAYGAQHTDQVVLDNTGMLCGLTIDIFAKLSAISVSVIMFMTLIFESWIIYILYSNCRNHPTGSLRGIAGVATVTRLLTFTLLTIIGLGASLTYLTTKGADTATANLLQSIPPVSFLFIFGLQSDIIRAWMFWRKDTPISSSTGSMQGLSRSQSPAMEVKIDLVRSTSYPGEDSEVKAMEV